MKTTNRSIVRSIQGNSMWIGFTWILWELLEVYYCYRTGVIEKIDETEVDFLFHANFRNIEDDFVSAFYGVYGPTTSVNRRQLWDKLAGLTNGWNVLRCMWGGNFNEIIFPSETGN
jgi:hypothetical protein